MSNDQPKSHHKNFSFLHILAIEMYEGPDDMKVYDLCIPAEVVNIKEEPSDAEEEIGSELSQNNHSITIRVEKEKDFLPPKESENSSSYFKKFEDEGWTERLIQTIQSKPGIYNNDIPGHSDRNVISRLWNEVYETMFPSWQNMSSNERFAKGKDLQGKWRNLRTCFRRELNKQRHDGRLGQNAKKRRKYVYFNQLLFLLPSIQDRPTVNECSPVNVQEENSDTEVVESQADDFNDTSTQKSQSTPKTKITETYKKSLLSVRKEKKEEKFDEDKSFLLSLVSSFKGLTNVQKLEAKIEFLSTLKRLSQTNQECAYHGPQGHGTCPSYGLPHHYNMQNEGNHLSGSSTPIPLASDVSQASRGSSFDQLSPHQDFPDF